MVSALKQVPQWKSLKVVYMNRKVIVIGAGGHGKVIADIIHKSDDILVGFLDDGLPIGTTILGYEVLGKIEEAVKHQEECEFIIGIGNNTTREKISASYDLKWYTAIHPTAQIGLDVTIQAGTVVMANAVINPSSVIGRHCIINTGSIVEHDNVIEDFVHLSPHATLCGTVKIGRRTHVGAGAIVKNNLSICSDCLVGAGCVVVKSILEKGIYVGVPAKRLHS